MPAEALLEAFTQASDDAMLSLDGSGMVMSWNHAAERCFGYTSAEILGRPSSALFPDHVRPDIEVRLAQVHAGDRVYHFETEILRKDGMPAPISVSMGPIYDALQIPVASIVIARDITEQRLAQAALAEIVARVRATARHWRTWGAGCGTAGPVWCSGATSSTACTASIPSISKGTLDAHLAVIHADDRARVQAALDAAVVSGQPFDDRYRIVRPDQVIRTYGPAPSRPSAQPARWSACAASVRTSPTASDDTAAGPAPAVVDHGSG